MKIYLGDIIPTSTLDWPGKVVMTVFTRGCPFRCPYCSNFKFIEIEEDRLPDDTDRVLHEIDRAKDYIDAVVFSGGEPFMQYEAMREIAGYGKQKGLLIGVETNGAYPEKMKSMIDEDLLDAVLLDVKAPLRQKEYSYAMGFDSEEALFQAVKATIDICRTAKADGRLAYFEVRSTVFEGICDKPEDAINIIRSIGPCDAYVLQQGRPELAEDSYFRKRETVHRNHLIEMGSAALPYAKESGVGVIKVRTHAMGDEIVK